MKKILIILMLMVLVLFGCKKGEGSGNTVLDNEMSKRQRIRDDMAKQCIKLDGVPIYDRHYSRVIDCTGPLRPATKVRNGVDM